MARQRNRTVLGVTLRRVAPDTWGANGWEFRALEGERSVGQEWSIHPPAGQLVDGNEFAVAFSLRGAVGVMLRHAPGRGTPQR